MFFTEKAEVFVKHLQYNIIGIILNMLSLEVLFIGLAKLKGHPGLRNLDSKAILAKEIRENLWRELQESLDAEKMIWNSYVSLLSCMNLVRNERNAGKSPQEIVTKRRKKWFLT